MGKHFWKSLIIGMMVTGIVAGCGSEKEESREVSLRDATPITVSAAASLRESMGELSAEFLKKKGLGEDKIRLNFAGSGTLRQQIEQGAPVSIFIAADEKNMNMLKEKGLIKESRLLLENTLVLIVPKGKTPYAFDTLKDAQSVSIGTLETVPAGRYAMETLTSLGILNEVQSKLVYAKDVRAVLAQVQQGAVDAGFVYKTDALRSEVTIVKEAPANSHKAIYYPVGVVVNHGNTLSQAFYEYLFTEEASHVFEKYGFKVVK